MITSGQDVMVLSFNDQELASGQWSDTLDSLAYIHSGYAVVINSDPPEILADYRAEGEPLGGYVVLADGRHYVSFFEAHIGTDYDTYEEAMDVLMGEIREYRSHAGFAEGKVIIPMFFVSWGDDGLECKVYLGNAPGSEDMK